MSETPQGKRVLITGGSGLIGARLSRLLTDKGFEVRWLSRTRNLNAVYKTYQWNVEKGEIDKDALENLHGVVHLAGAGVADKRWTDARKKEILESRTKSTSLIVSRLLEQNERPKVFVGASAIGYYGLDTGDTLLNENSTAASDFLAQVVKAWEESSETLSASEIRRVLIRVGIVLSKEGGALKELAAPIKWGFGAPLGSGRQWMSWIHIDDLCRLFADTLQNEGYKGIYNGVAPHPATNRELTAAAAKALNKPLWLPPVPAFALKLVLGEMSGIVVGGNKVSSEKIMAQGFSVEYQDLSHALTDLFRD